MSEAYKHREAFALMWYACEGTYKMERAGSSVVFERRQVKPGCGHRERFWNSRDGVTPFCTVCPSCGEPSLQHVDWQLDQCAPDHKPHEGQRVWVTMTHAAASLHYAKQIKAACNAGRYLPFGPKALDERISGMLASGEPDLVVWGYDEKGPQ